MEAVIHKYDDKPNHAEALTIKIKIAKVIQSSSTTKGRIAILPAVICRLRQCISS
jgi:hypothetical protein